MSAKGYGFLSFARNMSKNIDKNMSKNISSKHGKKILDHAKQSASKFKTASKKSNLKISRKNW